MLVLPVVVDDDVVVLRLYTPCFSSTTRGSQGCKVCFYFTPLSLSHTHVSWCLGSTSAVCVLFEEERVFLWGCVEVIDVGVFLLSAVVSCQLFFFFCNFVFVVWHCTFKLNKISFQVFWEFPHDHRLNPGHTDLCGPCLTDSLCPTFME